MINIIFYLSGQTFSYRFLSDWTGLLQECPNYKVSWKAVFAAPNDHDDYDYLMVIDSECIFEPGQFNLLLQKIEQNPDIHSLSAKSLKKDSPNRNFTLSRKSGRKTIIDQEVVIGYETTVIWR